MALKRKKKINSKYFRSIQNPADEIISLLRLKQIRKSMRIEAEELKRNVNKKIYNLSKEMNECDDKIESIMQEYFTPGKKGDKH